MPGLVQPSATSRAQFRAVVLGLKAADKTIRAEINAGTRSAGNPIWKESLAAHAGGNSLDSRIFLKGARVAAGNPSRAIAASSRRPVTKNGGGIVPDRDGAAWEFGAPNRSKKSSYSMRTRGGKNADVTRRTMRGMPAPRRQGRVVYPAWADTGPRLVSLWVQTIVRTIHNALEGK